MVIYVKNTDSGLLPLYDSDLHEKKKLKLGEDYRVEIRRARNIQFHKKYFALIKCAWLNLPERFDELYPHPENLRKALQIEAGYFEKYYLIDGTEVIDSKSIAFENMTEEEFGELYSRVLDVILKHILPQNSEQEIEEELINFM